MSVSQYINGDVILMFKSSQVKYIYNTDCIKAASQYQS